MEVPPTYCTPEDIPEPLLSIKLIFDCRPARRRAWPHCKSHLPGNPAHQCKFPLAPGTEPQASQDDPDAADKCGKRLLDLKQAVDEAEEALEWPALVAEA